MHETSVSLDKTIAVRETGRLDTPRKQRVAYLIQCISFESLWTRAGEILSANGNSNGIADSYFLPWCGSLVDNQSGLKG